MMSTPESQLGGPHEPGIEFHEGGSQIRIPLPKRGLTARIVFPLEPGLSVYDPTEAIETLEYSHGFPGRFEVVTASKRRRPRLLRKDEISTVEVRRPATLQEVVLAVKATERWVVGDKTHLSDTRYATTQDFFVDGRNAISDLIAQGQDTIDTARLLLDQLR